MGQVKTQGLGCFVQPIQINVTFRRTEPNPENFINFIKSINEEGSAAITKLSDIQKLVDNSTDKFFVSFAHKVTYTTCINY